ncbi:MAG TPA: hypothetical protein VGC18_16080 [Lacisediminihabitans sp.]|uniref:Acg family FMN-binding oxidoreductase n=1 Tax=Lacisediminihabitans sp. TaxID=2787631 RepID=UPI002EDB77E9
MHLDEAVVVTGTIVLLLAIVLLAVGGLFVRAEYLAPWDPEYAARFTDRRLRLAAHGMLAPSGHNMQPWIVRLDEDADVFFLSADAGRLTPAVDPPSRQTMVSQGTFLEYLRVAAVHLGLGFSCELFPLGRYDEKRLAESMASLPVARITLSGMPPDETEDYDSIHRSSTNRGPYGSARLGPDQITVLTGITAGLSAEVEIVDRPEDLAALGRLTVDGTAVEAHYPEALREWQTVFHANERAKNAARSGFAVEGQGTSGFMKYLLQGMITLAPALNGDAATGRRNVSMATTAAEHTPAYCIVRTAGNSRVEQIEAGMLYARLSLRARTLGLVVQPVSQVLQEYPSMSALYAIVHDEFARDGQTIQMLVRLGSPTADYPPTMRRDVLDILVPELPDGTLGR